MTTATHFLLPWNRGPHRWLLALIAALAAAFPRPAAGQSAIQWQPPTLGHPQPESSKDAAPVPKALSLMPAVIIHNAGGVTTFTPTLAAQGSFCLHCAPAVPLVHGTVGLIFKPEPIAGSVADVAERIRASAGLVELTLGIHGDAFARRAAGDGPLGAHLALGAVALLQRAHVAGEGEPLAAHDFAMAAVDATLGAWFVYGYAGYNLRWYRAFAAGHAARPLAEAVDGITHRAVVIVPVTLFVAASADDQRRPGDIFAELALTSGASLDDIAVGLSFSFHFAPL